MQSQSILVSCHVTITIGVSCRFGVANSYHDVFISFHILYVLGVGNDLGAGGGGGTGIA